MDFIGDQSKKDLYIFLLIFNMILFLLGISYQLFGTNNMFWNIYGFFMLCTFSFNIFMAYQESKYNWINYLYLFSTPIVMSSLIIVNYLGSSNPKNYISQSMISTILIQYLYILGGIISLSHLCKKQKNKSSGQSSKSKRNLFLRKLIKITLTIPLSILLCTGLWISFHIMKPNNGYSFILVSHLSLFYTFIFLSIGLLIQKLLKPMKLKFLHHLILVVTIHIAVVCLFPLISVPILVHNAEDNYSTAFGDYYKMNPIFKSDHYRQLRFFLPEYFYGTKSGEYHVQENILFYEGKEGKEEGLELYFDVYTPSDNAKTLPGGNSVLIRIHGGGWVLGNKGVSNSAQMNKYFASQGYIVFDIQYGLSKFNPFYFPSFMKDVRYGNYTIDDMVSHIGEFTTYLVNHSEKYNANTHSVFISGGSAGGNLALAAGLGLTSGNYTNILDSRIQVKGFIPFYPANELPLLLGIGRTKEFIDPSLLIDKNTPPCLIFHGAHDGIVDTSISESLRLTYLENKNKKCAIIYMPFGEHGCDMYFSGYYNQVFLYYMERFMYQFK